MYSNVQVTFDANLANARSESAVSVNPRNAANIVGASKKFTNPHLYEFTLAAYSSFDGGQTWAEAPPLQLEPGWGGVSDPTLAWDGAGNVYLVALPFAPGASSQIGIAVYRSTDGGRTFGSPLLIHSAPLDDKQWAAADTSPSSPFHGRVYAVWDNGTQPSFARTLDNGASWTGTAGNAAGAPIGSGSFAPQVSVGPQGTVYVAWIAGQFGHTIMLTKSTDGGDTFSTPAAAVTDLTPLTSPPLPHPGQFPELPGATFRVLTVPALTAGSGNTVVLAWADLREGTTRIYYTYSHDGGASWPAGPTGRPLRGSGSGAGQQDFHPQLARRPDGSIGCAFYSFGPKWSGGPSLIDVELATSHDSGNSFGGAQRVTDRSWDPAIDAPWSHGQSNTTFIGEYFGLDGSARGWSVFWTDTRTGVQEMFYGTELRLGPWSRTQFVGTLEPHQTVAWFTWGWPATWYVVWHPMVTTPDPGHSDIVWNIRVERGSPYWLTYHVIITNLTDRRLDIEGRYSILAM